LTTYNLGDCSECCNDCGYIAITVFYQMVNWTSEYGGAYVFMLSNLLLEYYDAEGNKTGYREITDGLNETRYAPATLYIADSGNDWVAESDLPDSLRFNYVGNGEQSIGKIEWDDWNYIISYGYYLLDDC